MRRFSPIACIVILTCSLAFGEGTRELAPNAAIMIGANTTTDLAALHINNAIYNSFAAYSNPDPKSRLYIHVRNPQTECLYVGFSGAHANANVPNPPTFDYEFRIKDPNGNVVFGPVSINPGGENIHSWLEGFTGPAQIHGASGYDAFEVPASALGSQGWTGIGDYYIEFSDEFNSAMLIDFWDITVADCSGGSPAEKKGRVWSYNWSIFAVNDNGFPNRPFNGAFYVCAPDPVNVNASFVTKIDFNNSGFRPAAFNIAINSFGSQNIGDVAENRKSVRNANATQAEYAIFLNDPVEICETAEIGTISLLGVTRCDAESFCIKFITSKAGQIDLLLDFDGNDNIYTPGTADLKISQNITNEQVNIPSCVPWDGRDGLGNLITETAGTPIPVTIAFAQGIYHFPIYDSELMTRGVIVQAIRPAAPNPLIYYDDSNIGVPSGTGEPVTQLDGCTTPCHGWTNYTQPDIIGFGNLNTINSWWFSQLIVRQDVFLLPGYYACSIEGPQHFCNGGTSELSLNTNLTPAAAEAPEIIEIKWNGPGIVSSSGNPSITLDEPGQYTADLTWVTALGDTCSSSCTYTVTQDPPITSSIDTLILLGSVIDINGQSYSQGGQYQQVFTSATGCDSILLINITILNTVIVYDLDDCYSNTGDGSSMNYSEFVPAYPQPLSCATLTGGTLHRELPQENKHSCTPGVNNSIAMCVSSLNSCTYVPGNSAAVVFTLTVTPAPDTAVHVTGISFYSQAPANFNWISGDSGPNNYPTKYGLRVLKNGTEIFLVKDVPTTQAWQLEEYDFSSLEDFIVDETSTFTFELLPYCLVGNGAFVAAYDMDDIKVQAGCVSPAGLNPLVSGVVKTPQGKPVNHVEIQMARTASMDNHVSAYTDETGHFAFDPVERKHDYFLKGLRDGDDLNGVNTLDLILIQKHLLGITPFSSAFDYIAADANKNNAISAIDLIELRKLILGIYTALPKNQSWRFFSDQPGTDHSDPWLLIENPGIEYLTRDVTDMDLVAVKIGDINGDAVTTLGQGVVESRGSDNMSLTYQDQWLEENTPVHVDFYSTAAGEIAGMQFALNIDGMDGIQLSGGVLNPGVEHYNVTDFGTVRMSWNGTNPISISSGEKLFGLDMTSETSGWLSAKMKFVTDQLLPEMYMGTDLERVKLELQGITTESKAPEQHPIAIYPNPFEEETTIEFRLDNAQEIQLNVYDASGRLLVALLQKGIAGENRMTLHQSDLQHAEGLLICQIRTNEFNAVKRVMILK